VGSYQFHCPFPLWGLQESRRVEPQPFHTGKNAGPTFRKILKRELVEALDKSSYKIRGGTQDALNSGKRKRIARLINWVNASTV